MTHEELIVLAIQGATAQLPPQERENVAAAAFRIRSVVDAYPSGAGAMALALVAAQFAAQ